MKYCKILAGIPLLIWAILLPGCASPKAPADVEAAKARILECGWNLSYTEEAEDLAELAAGFDFNCEGLTAYLIAKDSADKTLLEVLFFESERDSEAARAMLAGKLGDPDRYGRSGSQVWYGEKSAVERYLE